jgi:hypothetical protein
MVWKPKGCCAATMFMQLGDAVVTLACLPDDPGEGAILVEEVSPPVCALAPTSSLDSANSMQHAIHLCTADSISLRADEGSFQWSQLDELGLILQQA